MNREPTQTRPGHPGVIFKSPSYGPEVREPQKTIEINRGPGGGGAAETSTCWFGRIITWTEGEGESAVTKTGIRGGIIHCGDQTWNMDPQELDLEAAGVWLVSIKPEVEVNRDDDNQWLMPQVKTGTKPTGDWDKTAWTEGTDYPDGDSPEVSDGLGHIVLPIGKLTIADGAASLEPAGCGHFTIGHCYGTLTYTRA